MRQPAPSATGIAAAGIAVVFAVAFFAPWDPAARGGVGAVIAAIIAVSTAIVLGTRSGAPLLAGAAVGLLFDVAYISGCAIAYELGWWDVTWHSFGDTGSVWGSHLVDAVFAIIFYALPAAILGAVLARCGSLLARRS